MTLNDTAATSSIAEHPIHPYSSLAMQEAILQAVVRGESVYDYPQDNLPPLQLAREANGVIMVSSQAPLNAYLPFEQDGGTIDLPGIYAPTIPDLTHRNSATLFELCCSEIYLQPFSVIDRKTLIASKAIYDERTESFFVEADKAFFMNIKDLEKQYEIVPQQPVLKDYRHPETELTDDDFWKMIEQCQWKRDFDYDRIKLFLNNTFAPETLMQFEEKVGNLKGLLYKVMRQNPEEFAGIYTAGDGFSDCINHVVGSGKKAFHKCVSDPGFFAKFACSGQYKESFGYAVPIIYQSRVYPYPLRLDKSMPSAILTKAMAVDSLRILESIDYDKVKPNEQDDLKLKVEQSIYRLQNLLEGNVREAYQNFDKELYRELLLDIPGVDVHPDVSGCIANVMKLQGLDYKTVQWINGKPVMPAKNRQLDPNAKDVGYQFRSQPQTRSMDLEGPVI